MAAHLGGSPGLDLNGSEGSKLGSGQDLLEANSTKYQLAFAERTGNGGSTPLVFCARGLSRHPGLWELSINLPTFLWLVAHRGVLDFSLRHGLLGLEGAKTRGAHRAV